MGAAQVARAAAPIKRRLDFDGALPPTKRLRTLDPALLPLKKRPLPPDAAAPPPDPAARLPDAAAPLPAKRLRTLDPATLPLKKRPLPPALAASAGAPAPRADAGAAGPCNSGRVYYDDSGRVCLRVKLTARLNPRSTPTAWRPPCARLSARRPAFPAQCPHPTHCAGLCCRRAEQVCSAVPAARPPPAPALIRPAARRAAPWRTPTA